MLLDRSLPLPLDGGLPPVAALWWRRSSRRPRRRLALGGLLLALSPMLWGEPVEPAGVAPIGAARFTAIGRTAPSPAPTGTDGSSLVAPPTAPAILAAAALAAGPAAAAIDPPVVEQPLVPAHLVPAHLAPAHPAIEGGEASYYARLLEGRPTASGEIYRGSALTAAHRTLPFGTHLRVTNLTNGRSVEVRVNDRGPFHRRRVVDLSRAAAERLDMVHRGHAAVRLEVVASAERG
jgi:rare lipoprotein A